MQGIYKLHLTPTSTCELVVPITTEDVTIVNVLNNYTYVPLTSSSVVFSLSSALYVASDPRYDDKICMSIAKMVENRSGLFPLEMTKNTPKERLELVCFY